MSDVPTIAGVYAILNEVTGKLYIGSAINLKRRKDRHFSDLVGGYHHNRYLQRAFNKYGLDVFSFHVIEIVEDHELLIPREQFYMNEAESYKRGNGYNLSPTASSMLGTHHSDEARQRISAGNLGKKISDQTRAKISVARRKAKLGKKLSSEHCRKISEGNSRWWKQYYAKRDQLQLLLDFEH